ncbi:MAG: polysaccharide pyruvyl transferase family protein [Flaviramulus sp.]|nr:polysaccharide pyruvyl transferase family protein [Flaviramulus sp.]NNC50656.1 polysaccharide pyruvyl transferase family protein [Flaviramulus sp.]
MKIKTITCHEVYNHGASLQEYALLTFLENQGHETETIHYKPHYLSEHFNFRRISNPKYEKNIILKSIYLILKFPFRFKMLKRKRSFDAFSDKYIKATEKLYKTNDDLKLDLPEADAYICGSDQIWNSLFLNGKDPAFYLDFVPDNKLKISYAASFAIDKLEDNIKSFVKQKVSRLNHVSVRESSGKTILSDLGINDVTHVLDPVFLLEKSKWEKLCLASIVKEDYIFVYDFDSNPLIESFVMKQKEKYGYNKVVSVNSNVKYADYNFYLDGPSTFLTLLSNAKFVVTNSFHAVAFSCIFKKQFTVFNRSEKINTRMRDFVSLLKIEKVLMLNKNDIENYNYFLDYDAFDKRLAILAQKSKDYLTIALKQ